MNIFVSYTTRDQYIDRELLESVFDIVSHYGHCYIDLLHNDTNDKQRHVELMLSQAKLLILISSTSIGKSEWVQWELAEAGKRHIPMLIIQATPDRKETLSNLRSGLVSEFRLLSKTMDIKSEWLTSKSGQSLSKEFASLPLNNMPILYAKP
ncbi:TIR domain-containing protein [Hafnia alvei]|uniref:MTH538 TIR-like domain (DUF1863) n=1 Tax=Hafnia alvei TaxID=569 RepID=A0A1C6Z3H8_HAFAL|nr:TIR domain-containing protein [Hafnia alvei]NLS55673.1 hypothetical protein [Hafnia alvei]SCM53723.1 MTH538 TIR-like domain (DUF1863) [Hafnia alvei]